MLKLNDHLEIQDENEPGVSREFVVPSNKNIFFPNDAIQVNMQTLRKISLATNEKEGIVL